MRPSPQRKLLIGLREAKGPSRRVKSNKTERRPKKEMATMMRRQGRRLSPTRDHPVPVVLVGMQDAAKMRLKRRQKCRRRRSKRLLPTTLAA